jgi:hypothetical protein
MSNYLSITDQINTQYRTYALYVLQSRGIPNFYDGLTPVQRLILENSPIKYNKTIGLVGEVIKTGLYHHGDCIDGDTEINLADGTTIKISEWEQKYPDARLLVKCADDAGNLTISLGHSPRIGQITDEFIEIEMENGETFKCTYNHPFLVRDKGWVKAEDLSVEDDIISV